jgi:hypothetical protein
MMNS